MTKATPYADDIHRPHSARLCPVRSALPEAFKDHLITYPVWAFLSPNIYKLSDFSELAREPVFVPFPSLYKDTPPRVSPNHCLPILQC